MQNVIQFPPNNERDLRASLTWAKNVYMKAGLTTDAADAALTELKPLLEPFFEPFKTVLDIPLELGLSDEQIEAIRELHNNAVQELIAFHLNKIGLAMQTIAGLVGAKHATEGIN